MRYSLTLLLILLLAASAKAKELKLAAGLSLPPYIIQEQDSGMEFDIIREALAAKGHTLKLVYLPFVRLTVDYKKYDGAITINESSGIKGNYSDGVITYKNYAISLQGKGVKVNTIQDLKEKSIIAFQNATKYLGPEYAAAVKANPRYKEQGKQELQVKMLYSGRTDVVVSDINIFNYYRKRVSGVNTSAPVTLHEIFDGVVYKVLFKDPSVRDDFNEGLRVLRESGRYDEIVAAYVK